VTPMVMRVYLTNRRLRNFSMQAPVSV
jgi:hypothetical protein